MFSYTWVAGIVGAFILIVTVHGYKLAFPVCDITFCGLARWFLLLRLTHNLCFLAFTGIGIARAGMTEVRRCARDGIVVASPVHTFVSGTFIAIIAVFRRMNTAGFRVAGIYRTGIAVIAVDILWFALTGFGITSVNGTGIVIVTVPLGYTASFWITYFVRTGITVVRAGHRIVGTGKVACTADTFVRSTFVPVVTVNRNVVTNPIRTFVRGTECAVITVGIRITGLAIGTRLVYALVGVRIAVIRCAVISIIAVPGSGIYTPTRGRVTVIVIAWLLVRDTTPFLVHAFPRDRVAGVRGTNIVIITILWRMGTFTGFRVTGIGGTFILVITVFFMPICTHPSLAVEFRLPLHLVLFTTWRTRNTGTHYAGIVLIHTGIFQVPADLHRGIRNIYTFIPRTIVPVLAIRVGIACLTFRYIVLTRTRGGIAGIRGTLDIVVTILVNMPALLTKVITGGVGTGVTVVTVQCMLAITGGGITTIHRTPITVITWLLDMLASGIRPAGIGSTRIIIVTTDVFMDTTQVRVTGILGAQVVIITLQVVLIHAFTGIRVTGITGALVVVVTDLVSVYTFTGQGVA